jgi:dTMP kinase
MLKPPTPLDKRGLLVVGEGLDGSGKTEVMRELARRLHDRGRGVLLTNWNDTVEIYNIVQELTATGEATPELRIVLGAAELAARYRYEILPALERGDVVLANKYVVSALAHACARGHERDFVLRAYRFAPSPDLTLYFDVTPEVALERKLARGSIGFWESGLDRRSDAPLDELIRRYDRGEIPGDDLSRSFVEFQSSLRYVHMVELEGSAAVARIDASRSLATVVEEAFGVLEGVLAGGAP